MTIRLLVRELRGLSVADIGAAFAAISPLHWALALCSTGLAYAALAWYDQIALAHLGRRLSWRFVGLVSFTTYALAHNIGATMLSGAVVRYRAYSTKGLGMAEVGVLVAFCSFTFTLGNLLLGGLTLLLGPNWCSRYVELPDWAGALSSACALLGVPCALMLGSLLHFRAAEDSRVRAGLSAPADRGAAIARRADRTASARRGSSISRCRQTAIPASSSCSAVFLASFTIALISHAPGGLGVLEYSFLKAMPDAPAADVLAALLVFRLLYLIVPLLFSLVVVLIFERARIGELVRTRGGGEAMSLAMTIDASDALLVIDVQNDFVDGGALAVPGGDFDRAARQPAHRRLSAGRRHAGLAPARPCLVRLVASGGEALRRRRDCPMASRCCGRTIACRASAGAELHEELDVDSAFLILRKGANAEIDSYSAFTEADGKTTTGLDALLKARGVERIFACGLATDFCVAYSALDARAAGFETFVIEDACRAIDADGSLDAGLAQDELGGRLARPGAPRSSVRPYAFPLGALTSA